MRTIVVTGATSFIGKKVVSKALENGYKVVAVVRPQSRNKLPLYDEQNMQIIELEMKEYKNLSNYIEHVDCLIHLAWNGTRGFERLDESRQYSNVEAGIGAVSAVISSGCKSVILAGSQAEYGNASGIISESICSNPITAYGNAKLQLYRMASNLCIQNDARCREARLFSIYGPDDYENTLIMSLIKKMKVNEIIETTKGIQKWDYLYVDDAVNALLSLDEVSCPSGIFNIASGDIRLLKDYIEEVKHIIGSESKILYGAVPYPETGMISIEPNIDKIKNYTDWDCSVTFAEGIMKVYKSLEKNSEIMI